MNKSYKNDSILKLNEEEYISFILKKFLEHFSETLHLPLQYKYHIKVKGFSENDSDLDLLLADTQKPQFAWEFEFKVVKIKTSESINKLGGIKKCIHQTNAKIQLGFHKVYLIVLIIFDGREKVINNIFFRGADRMKLEEIYTRDLSKLDPKSGIAFIELIQPTSKNFLEQAAMNILHYRIPHEQIQSSALTEKIAKRLQDGIIYCQPKYQV